jgi:hypothetical protein
MIIVRDGTGIAELKPLAEERFGDYVKAVVDIERRVMAVGGDLHSDEEELLLDDGSRQQDLWGVNLHVGAEPGSWI